MSTYSCGNCGHLIEADALLAAMRFEWLNIERTASKTSCPACGATTLQRAWAWNELNMPYAGEFLIIRTFNTIRRT